MLVLININMWKSQILHIFLLKYIEHDFHVILRLKIKVNLSGQCNIGPVIKKYSQVQI